jgi:hypothetical protein
LPAKSSCPSVVIVSPCLCAAIEQSSDRSAFYKTFQIAAQALNRLKTSW